MTIKEIENILTSNRKQIAQEINKPFEIKSKVLVFKGS